MMKEKQRKSKNPYLDYKHLPNYSQSNMADAWQNGYEQGVSDLAEANKTLYSNVIIKK
jgi:hypothetical protein